SAAWNEHVRPRLGLGRRDRPRAQRSDGAVPGRISPVRQLSDDLPRREPPAAGDAGGTVWRPVLRALYLWLAGRAVRRVLHRRDGALVGSLPDLGAGNRGHRLPVLACGREALPLA